MVAVRNILSFDVEDWHQSTLDFDLPITSRVVENTGRILDLCEETRTKGTFFVLGLVAAAYPSLVRRIHESGHEVALHGYDHRPVHSMTPASFAADIHRSRDLVEQAAGAPITGYRAPDFSIRGDTLWALAVLAERGFRYDSSLFPFAGPRYGIAEAFAVPCRVLTSAGDLVEFPLATAEWFGRRFPAAGGGYFRVFPEIWHRAAIRRLNDLGAPATAYFHPYELDTEEIRSSPRRIPLRLRLSQGLMRSRVEGRLRRLLRMFSWGRAMDLLPDSRSLTEGRILDLTALPSGQAQWRSEASP